MKHPLCAFLVLISLTLTGCAAKPDAAPQPLLNTVCLVSGEPIDADVTADYMGGKVGFCCTKCESKWEAMDEAGKKAAFDAKAKK